jgi:hypothetical protein
MLGSQLLTKAFLWSQYRAWGMPYFLIQQDNTVIGRFGCFLFEQHRQAPSGSAVDHVHQAAG